MTKISGKDSRRGFIGTIISLIIGLSVLGYFFDFNVINFIKSPSVQNVLNYAKTAITIVWDRYISGVANYIWDEVVIDIVWDNMVKVATIIKDWVDSNQPAS
ncbi:MAG: hypothetical protein A2653_02450 [Candidatus Zambryskibacteria bacterium RIFCSPHIGHO2_01_FULL_43_25]|uniref:Uncharacterized protein n=1 Tax=Candidatus Zambryskibacteria bacterium RIFCSPLOWO2_01_FULL_45_21 TaxID=1802761 RepID=A0A1G2U302_9BACT|nr:MAG: hypothetical protein A2653_02450 [Candidatus Zambryskibacteria bacterium RIFCSPHIGHO2_01_FULL_43_25]OHB01058.1 MAG: hypothetical protein A3E94_02630 [Candidatus Zambryskibacteria bacterium RIFCSPHIGHO2_12_FULL_44_12b]OHB03897.1 MAG: hypothetical protein A3B14_01000 [Candidatus Zambryskibacteria bacterium RIFCSPLOWO2_01_FULL_45_21]